MTVRIHNYREYQGLFTPGEVPVINAAGSGVVETVKVDPDVDQILGLPRNRSAAGIPYISWAVYTAPSGDRAADLEKALEAWRDKVTEMFNTENARVVEWRVPPSVDSNDKGHVGIRMRYIVHLHQDETNGA